MVVQELIKTNFFLLCITLGIVFTVIRYYRPHTKMRVLPLLIVASTIVMALASYFDQYFKDHNLLGPALFCGWLGYALRPTVILLFIMLADDNRFVYKIAAGFVILNALIYATCFFIPLDGFSKIAFHYAPALNEDGSTSLHFYRGPLGYTAFVVSYGMIAYLAVYSILSLRGERKNDATAILICAGFILLASVLEALDFADNLLNTTIAIASFFFIFHISHQNNRIDALTGLNDRKTFYVDSARMRNSIRGVIQIDMNGLKFLNDTKGHEEGDIGLKTIAEALEKSLSRGMNVYRMGGDEFIILSTSSEEAEYLETTKRIKESLEDTPYTVSLGYAMRKGNEKSLEELSKEAEKEMYKDKSFYYQTSGIERRKARE